MKKKKRQQKNKGGWVFPWEDHRRAKCSYLPRYFSQND